MNGSATDASLSIRQSGKKRCTTLHCVAVEEVKRRPSGAVDRWETWDESSGISSDILSGISSDILCRHLLKLGPKRLS